jgi:hypothetical protein
MDITWPKIVAIAAGITVVIGAGKLVLTEASEIQTDSEAKIWRSGHVLTEDQRFTADRVDRVQRESDRLEYDLLDIGLTIKEIDFKKRQLIKNDAKIACIQDKTC